MKEHILAMLGGPGTLRFVVQPLVAVLFGVLHGIHDGRSGHEPFFITVVRARGRRIARLAEGLRAIVIPLTVALVASVVFQYIVRARVRADYAVAYAFLFVAIPYIVARGLANRIRWMATTRRTRSSEQRGDRFA